MSRPLVAAFVAAQALDLATYLQAPHLEANPLVALLPVELAVAAKVAGVGAVLGVLRALRSFPAMQHAGLAIGIAAGAFGAGANLASLSWVAAAEAPRSVHEPAPIASDATGFEEGSSYPAARGRTAAPSTSAAGPSTPEPASSPADAPAFPWGERRAIPALKAAIVPRGTASWYCCTRGFDRGDLVAAAGPALRRALGAGWRGSVVRVVAGGRAVTVRLVDWCQCYRGELREVLVDLHPAAFRELAPLSAGLVDVRVELVP